MGPPLGRSLASSIFIVRNTREFVLLRRHPSLPSLPKCFCRSVSLPPLSLQPEGLSNLQIWCWGSHSSLRQLSLVPGVESELCTPAQGALWDLKFTCLPGLSCPFPVSAPITLAFIYRLTALHRRAHGIRALLPCVLPVLTGSPLLPCVMVQGSAGPACFPGSPRPHSHASLSCRRKGARDGRWHPSLRLCGAVPASCPCPEVWGESPPAVKLGLGQGPTWCEQR